VKGVKTIVVRTSIVSTGVAEKFKFDRPPFPEGAVIACSEEVSPQRGTRKEKK